MPADGRQQQREELAVRDLARGRRRARRAASSRCRRRRRSSVVMSVSWSSAARPRSSDARSSHCQIAQPIAAPKRRDAQRRDDVRADEARGRAARRAGRRSRRRAGRAAARGPPSRCRAPGRRRATAAHGARVLPGRRRVAADLLLLLRRSCVAASEPVDRPLAALAARTAGRAPSATIDEHHRHEHERRRAALSSRASTSGPTRLCIERM